MQKSEEERGQRVQKSEEGRGQREQKNGKGRGAASAEGGAIHKEAQGRPRRGGGALGPGAEATAVAQEVVDGRRAGGGEEGEGWNVHRGADGGRNCVDRVGRGSEAGRPSVRLGQLVHGPWRATPDGRGVRPPSRPAWSWGRCALTGRRVITQ